MLRKFLKKLKKNSRRAYVSGERENIQTQSIPVQWSSSDNGTNSTTGSAITASYGESGLVVQGQAVSPSSSSDKRIEKKPVEVVHEILSELPKMNLTDIPKQIRIVQKRIRTLETMDSNASQEKEVLRYLNARKKFMRHGSRFNWVTTNQELIDKLCKTYKLRLVSFRNYARNVPAEAIDEIEKFMDAMEYIDKNLKPELQLVIDDGGKEERKDPILIAKSPFGRWFYILGAWDKEVEVVDEIIYNGR